MPATRQAAPAYDALVMLGIAIVMCLMLILQSTPSQGAGTYDSGKSDSTKKMHASLRVAEMAISQSDYQKALDSLTIVIADEPKNADAWNLTGYANRKSGNYEASRTAYERALSIEPDHKGALEYMGELHLTLGELAQAEALYERLKDACSYFCTERDTLKKAIQKYKKDNR